MNGKDSAKGVCFELIFRSNAVWEHGWHGL